MLSQFGLKYKPVNLENLDLAYNIQKEEWPDESDYRDLYDKAINTKNDNIEFLIYNDEILIGIVGVDVVKNYNDSIWLNWFTILPNYRKFGFGKKVLIDIIDYCKKINKYDYFRIDTTYHKEKPALFLYDKIMELKEKYTIEDTDSYKNNFLIYSYGLKKKVTPWNNKYLGLKKYYNNCK